MTSKKIFYSTVFLLITMYLGGCVSVLLGKELCWDLANYHYYSPYYFFHSRQLNDVWPTSFLHLYINPAIDFLSYGLINAFPAHISVFLLGAIHGINFWLLFFIAREFIVESKSLWQRNLLCLFIASLGIYGPTALPGMGSFQNDNLISLFVLSFVYLQVRCAKAWRRGSLCIAGVVLGIGMGLKLTAGIYAIGALLAWVCMPIAISKRLQSCVWLGLSISVGVMISSGYWMLLMWQEHHNPFFPFYNAIFHSPDFPWINWQDARFLPQTIMQKLFFPFYFSWDGRTGDVGFQDFRFLVIYLLGVAVFIRSFFVAKKNMHQPTLWLISFFIFSYLMWQHSFSIMRYGVALEMLAPLLIYLLLDRLIQNKHILMLILVLLFSGLILTMHKTATVRALWYRGDFFNVTLPKVAQDAKPAMVLMAYPAYTRLTQHALSKTENASLMHPRPQTYLIPFFPASWRFVGVPILNDQLAATKFEKEHIKNIVQSFSQKKYLLTSDRDMPVLYQVIHNFGGVPTGKCEKIMSDRQRITHQDVLLCSFT